MKNMCSLQRTLSGWLPPGVTFTRVRQGLALSVTVMAVSVSYGAISQAAGLAWWQTLLLAVLAFGGAAELLFVGVIASGGALLPAVFGGWLVNSRNFAFGLHVGTYAPTGWRLGVAAHFVNDETVAFPHAVEGQEAKWGNFKLISLLVLTAWAGGAVMGQYLGGVMDTYALGLDTAFPVVMVAMVVGGLRGRGPWATALAGIILALLATPHVPAGLGAITALVALVPWAIYERRKS